MSYYGENECRVSKEDTFEHCKKMVELKKIEERHEYIIIASDLNRKVGNDNLGIEGNSDEISYGGSLVRERIASGRYIFANNTDFVVGGPETRIDPADEMKKSVLDVFILSKGLEQYMDKMVIDDKQDYPMQ